jgi:formate dehydrogenase major subunit/formate dehydrogenase-N alpha subunit
MPDSGKIRDALSKLKFLVIIDPLQTETSTFWKNHGEFNDVDPAQIQTTVFRLPSSCFAEENGAIVNSGRWLQWHWAAQEPPFEARHDGRILGGIFMKLRELYAKEGGTCPSPDEYALGLPQPSTPIPRKWPRKPTATHWPTCSTTAAS